MANVLVTGGAGYIGSHAVKLLSSEGHKPIVLDNLSTGRRESVIAGELIVGDIADLSLVEKVIKDYKIESVLHFAGSIVVPESVRDPVKYYRNNTLNSLNFMDTCYKFGVRNFIFSSTAAVYRESDQALTEESTIGPITPYGHSKYMTETMLRDFAHAYPDFNYLILRYFNVAGADPENEIGQCSPGATHLIKVAMEAAVGKRDKLVVFGTDYPTPDGTCVRDYIHVTDLAQAHIDGLNYLIAGGKSITMNCGYGKGFSVNEVVEVMKSVTGGKITVETGERRPGDASILVSSNSKIKSTLGWTPKYDDLEFITKSAYEWEKKLLELKK